MLASFCVLGSSAAARQQEQRVFAPLPIKKKNTDRLCGHPLPALPVRGLPALRVVMLLLPVFAAVAPWQPRKRIRRNGAYVYNVVPKAFGWKLAEGFNAALVAKVLKGRGHLDVEKVG